MVTINKLLNRFVLRYLQKLNVIVVDLESGCSSDVVPQCKRLRMQLPFLLNYKKIVFLPGSPMQAGWWRAKNLLSSRSSHMSFRSLTGSPCTLCQTKAGRLLTMVTVQSEQLTWAYEYWCFLYGSIALIHSRNVIEHVMVFHVCTVEREFEEWDLVSCKGSKIT